MGPAFGKDDIFINGSHCNEIPNSLSYLGHTFDLPEGIKYGTLIAKTYLAGSGIFTVKEIEVYHLV